MIRSTIRSGIIALSSLSSAAPIEVITATFILVTLTYFQLLHAIKGSEFFQPPPTVQSPARPVHLVRLSNPLIEDSPFIHPSSPTSILQSFNSNLWAPLSSQEFRTILQKNAIEGGFVFQPEQGGNSKNEPATVVLVKQITVVKEDGHGGSIDQWEKWLLNDFKVELGEKSYTYQDLCFQCNTTTTPHPLYASQSTLTLYLLPPTPEIPTLNYLNQLNRLPPFTPAGTNTTFRLLPQATSSWGIFPSLDGAGLFPGPSEAASEREEEEALNGLRNVRWFAYAARALVMRFVVLAKVGRLQATGI